MRSRTLALLSLLGLLGSLLVTAPAHAADAPTRRTLDFQAPEQVRLATPTVLGATVTDGANPLPGRSVHFQLRVATGWQVLATVPTDAAGQASFEVDTTAAKARYRAVLAPEGDLPGTTPSITTAGSRLRPTPR